MHQGRNSLSKIINGERLPRRPCRRTHQRPPSAALLGAFSGLRNTHGRATKILPDRPIRSDTSGYSGGRWNCNFGNKIHPCLHESAHFARYIYIYTYTFT